MQEVAKLHKKIEIFRKGQNDFTINIKMGAISSNIHQKAYKTQFKTEQPKHTLKTTQISAQQV